MTQVGNVTWNGDAFEKDISAAIRPATNAAAEAFLNRVRTNINRQGTPTSKTGFGRYVRGLRLLGALRGSPVQRALATKSSKTAGRDIKLAESVVSQGGFVDPPGGMPRRRTETLLRSLDKYDDDDGVIAGAFIRYARIHEFGGTVNAKKRPWLVFEVLPKVWRKVKSVTIPARPFIRPSLHQSRGAMFDAFMAKVKERIG